MWEVWDGDLFICNVYTQKDADAFHEDGYEVFKVRELT